MKRESKKKVLLIAAACMGLVLTGGCEKESGKGNEIREKYFFVDNAEYVDGATPGGTEAMISDLTVNRSAITGGSTVLQFTSSERLTTVHIGVNGVPGYYRCDVSRTEPVRNGNGYEYQVVLLLSQRLSADFNIFVSAVSVAGAISMTVNSTEIAVIEVGTGKLQISLSWDKLDDVDLILVDPNNNAIFYAQPFAFDRPVSEEVWDEYSETFSYTSSTWEDRKAFFTSRGYRIIGELDLDSNAACDIDGVNNENITYEETAIPGSYAVAVNLWEKCTASGAKGSSYSVTANHNGDPVRIASRQTGKFADSDLGNSGLDVDKMVIIGTFTIGGTRSDRPAGPKQLVPIRKRADGKK
ncbi:MAG: hypothetical protein LBP50_02255 [Tannerella sp.]|nr:hypothetical protein [Tannerella sp.]